MMLGAEGVQCGTVFLCAQECTVHENYKQKVLSAKDIDTIVTGKRLGHAVRSIRNPFTRQYSKMEYEITTTGEELEAMGIGALRKAAVDGDLQEGCFLAGQCSAMIHEIRPAKDIIETMFSQAETLLKGAPQWVK